MMSPKIVPTMEVVMGLKSAAQVSWVLPSATVTIAVVASESRNPSPRVT
jgi:hypothetical protein